MNVREAIEQIIAIHCDSCNSNGTNHCETKCPYHIALLSMSKQVEKKPYRVVNSKSLLPVQCPECACHIGDDDFVSPYCGGCGQKIIQDDCRNY
jgi:hypothetical protein